MRLKAVPAWLLAAFFLMASECRPLTAENGASARSAARGHWEFNLHYSRWTLNPVKSLIEEAAGSILEDSLKENLLEEVRQDYPELVERGFSQNVTFDSGGDNFGLEARWYPGGSRGSFSLGLAIERSSLRISLPSVTASLELGSDVDPDRSASFAVQVSDASLRLQTTSLHFSLRWDLWPRGRVHPYVTFGLGIFSGNAIENGRVYIAYTGDLAVSGQETEHRQDEIDETIAAALEEGGDEVKLPPVLPYLQLSIGIKGIITRNVHLLLDFGIWNGFLLRGGLSFRL